jgi:hypothetical protein
LAETGIEKVVPPKNQLDDAYRIFVRSAHIKKFVNEAIAAHDKGEIAFQGRRENLSQANKLSRTYATLLEALNRHRGRASRRSQWDMSMCIPAARPSSASSSPRGSSPTRS